MTELADCRHVRRVVGADPLAAHAGVDAHVAHCADCAGYRREMRDLELRIRSALELPVMARPPGDRVVPLPLAPAAAPRRRFAPLPLALAAGVVLACVALGIAFLGRPQQALASALVEHMAHEPEGWSQQRPVPRSALDLVLRRSGVRLDAATTGEIVYAHSCFFRGRYVPHLVVRTARGPVTVLVLQGERIASRQQFVEGGYSGVLLPSAAAPVGLAVLGRGAAAPADLDEVARRIAAVVTLAGEPPAR